MAKDYMKKAVERSGEYLSGVCNILDPEEKKVFLNGIEAIVHELRGRNQETKTTEFDRVKAKKIREERDISVLQLLKYLRLSRSNTDIYKYEIGYKKPSNPPRGKTAPRYMNWLREHGY